MFCFLHSSNQLGMDIYDSQSMSNSYSNPASNPMPPFTQQPDHYNFSGATYPSAMPMKYVFVKSALTKPFMNYY